MKKTLTVLILIVFSVGGFAQNKDSVYFKNELGVVLTDLVDESLQLTYERALGKYFTLKVGTAYKGKNGLISLSGLDREHIKTSDLNYSGLKIVPEIRYYLSNTRRNILDGFYFGAYLKYSRFRSNLYGTYISNAGDNYSLNFDARLHISTLGLMVGYKLPLLKRFNLDFLIAGPGQSFHSYSIRSRTVVPDEFYNDLSETLKKYSFFDLLNSDIKFSSKTKKTEFGMPTFRYALTLGFKF